MAEETDNKALNDKEQAFADEYILHSNKKAAAIAAGYAENSAAEQGYQVYSRPHVKAYIDEKLRDRAITAGETIKLISDTAQSSITDYFKPVMVPFTPQIKLPLIDIINSKKEWIEREYEFCNRVGLSGEDYDQFMVNLQSVKNDIVRMEIELEKDTTAYRVVDGPIELREEMQLDINALVADKEKGKVKKIKYGKDGIEVEMYSAADAHDKLMKLHGAYAPNEVKHSGSVEVKNITGMEIK